jgi:hypothetical protein
MATSPAYIITRTSTNDVVRELAIGHAAADDRVYRTPNQPGNPCSFAEHAYPHSEQTPTMLPTCRLAKEDYLLTKTRHRAPRSSFQNTPLYMSPSVDAELSPPRTARPWRNSKRPTSHGPTPAPAPAPAMIKIGTTATSKKAMLQVSCSHQFVPIWSRRRIRPRRSRSLAGSGGAALGRLRSPPC